MQQVKVGGTTYTIMRGKTKIDGTGYTIFGGKTKVGGTAYAIDLGPLPSDYRRVKWIEARAKGPYVVLPFTSQVGLKATFEFAVSDTYFLSKTDGRYYNTWGYFYSSGYHDQEFLMFKSSGSSALPSVSIDYGGVGARISNLSLEANTLYEVSIVTRGDTSTTTSGFCSVTFDGQTVTNTDMGDTGRGIDGGDEMRLFTLKYFGATSNNYPGPGMFGRMTFSDSSNNVLCDLWPCYRRSDGEPGFWDSVGKTFLSNSGSGTLYAGPTVIS